MTKDSGVLDGLNAGLTPEQAEKLGKASVAHKAASEARAAFIASLPEATSAEFSAVWESVRNETDQPEGLNQTFRLSEEQKVDLKTAREERRAELADKKVRARYQRMAGSMALVSARLRVTRSDKGKVKKSLTLRYAK